MAKRAGLHCFGRTESLDVEAFPGGVEIAVRGNRYMKAWLLQLENLCITQGEVRLEYPRIETARDKLIKNKEGKFYET